MKQASLFLIFVFSINFSFAQIQSSYTDNAVLIANAYERDIHYIAVQRLHVIKHVDTSKIIVPQIHKDSIIKAMSAVFNLGIQLQADSVFNRYCIHSIESEKIDSIYVRLDTTVSWTSAWRNGMTITTNSAINSLISQYGFIVANSHPSASGVTLYSPQITDINLYAFGDSLETFQGINSTHVDVVIYPVQHPHGNIFYNVDSVGNTTFDFLLNWEFDGFNYRRWHYDVNNNCQVIGWDTLFNFYYPNTPIPAPTNCNLGPSTTNNFSKVELKVYPNPTSNLLNISVREKGEITIRDLTGRIVEHLIADGFSTTINISNQPNGIYFLQFTNENGTAIQKLVKE